MCVQYNATTKHTTAVSGTESIKDDIKSPRKLVVDIQKEQRAIKVSIHDKIDSVAEDMKKNIENELANKRTGNDTESTRTIRNRGIHRSI